VSSIPNPATTDWVPLAGGAGVPTPVVNGQWVKGSGGAAVWSAIAQADLPANLQGQAPAFAGADYNNGLAAGWYFGLPNDANAPPGGYYCHVLVFQFPGPQYKQVAHRYDSLDKFERIKAGGGAWSAWVQTQFAPVGWTNLGYLNGWGTYPGFGPARYRKDSSGYVHTAGLVAGGSSFGAQITTLPAGARPGVGLILSQLSASLACDFRIDPSGAMYAIANASTTWISLDGITFFAEL
jgi:hypothetical protein